MPKKEILEINGSKPEDAVSKIETIKNLIFGEDIEAYDSEIESIKKDILKRKQEIQKLIEETRAELDGSIDNLSTDLNIRITELHDSLKAKSEALGIQKVDKELLGKLLIDLGEKIKS